MRRSMVLVVVLALAPGASAQELTENNAEQWGTFAPVDGAATSVANEFSRVKVGAASLRFTTASGFDTGVKYPANPTANLDLTGKNSLRFWAYAINNTPIGFQGNQPIVVLKTPTGNFTYTPNNQLMSNFAWRLFKVPLAGDSTWQRSQTGAPDLTRVRQLEIHQDTWDAGFEVIYDGLEFVTITPGQDPPPGPPPPAGVDPDLVAPKVLLYIFDPIMNNYGGVRLHQAYGWGDPVALTTQVINDFWISSHNKVAYQVVETVISDEWPYLQGGFQYTDVTFDAAWRSGNLQPGTFDYVRFGVENTLGARVDAGDFDEVWVYAFPGAGMWESAMAGGGAYWINGVPYPDAGGERAFPIMGWNYERGVGEAIHSYGHRCENVMMHSYGPWQNNQSNAWNRFSLLHKDAPGLGGIGNVHFPFNATSDYDYANTLIAPSNADEWYNYPNFIGATRSFNCLEWTPLLNDPQREYLNWWYDHMPHMPGRGPDYFLMNWWRYLADIDQFKSWDGNLYLSDGIPTVATTVPTDGSTVSGVVQIRANASVDGALGRVDFYVDGVYRGSDTLAPYTFDWDTADPVSGGPGPHTIVTKAYELRVGTEAVSTPITVNVRCPSDFNSDGFVSGDDFDLYVAAFEIGDEAADFNADGFVTGDDFDLFVAAFETGC